MPGVPLQSELETDRRGEDLRPQAPGTSPFTEGLLVGRLYKSFLFDKQVAFCYGIHDQHVYEGRPV